MKMMHKVKMQTIIKNTLEKCQSNKQHGLIGLSPLPLTTPLLMSLMLLGLNNKKPLTKQICL